MARRLLKFSRSKKGDNMSRDYKEVVAINKEINAMLDSVYEFVKIPTERTRADKYRWWTSDILSEEVLYKSLVKCTTARDYPSCIILAAMLQVRREPKEDAPK